MTVIEGNIQDIGMAPLSGVLVATSVDFRASGDVVIAPESRSFPVEAGLVSADLVPGPTRLTVQVGSHARGEFDVVVPDEGPVSLASLVEEAFPWEPEQIAEFVRLRDEAVAAAQDAAGSADAADGSATAAAGSASAAASSAGEAASSAQGAAASAQAAAGSESAAAGSAASADGSAQAAAQSASDAAASAVVAADGAQVITDNLSAIEAAPGAASDAAASASAAAGHAQDAAGSASSAASSASAAASSASSAADDASDAAGSASDAASSASDADQSATAAASSASDAAGSASVAAGHASAAGTDADRAQQYAEDFGLSMTAVTGDPGTPAQVVVSGDGPAYEVALTVPQGEKGDPGPPGEVSQAALDAALAGKADLVDGIVPESQLPELGGSTDASLLTGALTGAVDATKAMVDVNLSNIGGPESETNSVSAWVSTLYSGVMQAIDGLSDKADAAHTHTAAEVGAVANAGGAAGLWIGTTANLPATGTAGVLYVNYE